MNLIELFLVSQSLYYIYEHIPADSVSDLYFVKLPAHKYIKELYLPICDVC